MEELNNETEINEANVPYMIFFFRNSELTEKEMTFFETSNMRKTTKLDGPL